MHIKIYERKFNLYFCDSKNSIYNVFGDATVNKGENRRDMDSCRETKYSAVVQYYTCLSWTDFTLNIKPEHGAFSNSKGTAK